ncbi:hypothetical protein T310_5551 [Rasamsonia emersonii CBS 393.64]|uniref:Uncharacterized protein n=1 Tax=Rasamsonia emersonii (strain ATCC 16479 / CBS 393.64 / IMI 116815) TaxID=1408163 RepID=A0A0F4YQ71_RASE3|nr:hypothetical protein T310_5551 [Rasamsonia emersonii CBS 393.64]KKA20432.1 hypothetical protein T310_5551 [Rasamsonia emersonii CBS 393.64]
MAGEDPFAFLATAEPPKPLKKSNWREKLFSKDRDAKQSAQERTEKQLDDFLGPTRSKPPNQEPTLPQIDNVPPPEPRPFSSTPPTGETQGIRVVSPTKKPRRKGLRVTFSDRAPEIIGEGGDESEEPTVEIFRRRDQPHGLDNRRPTLPQLHIDTSFQDDQAEPQEQTEVQRTPLLINTQDADFLMALNAGERGSRLSFRASPDSNSFAKRIHARMQAEEARALQRRYEEDLMSPTSPDDERQQRHETLPLRPSISSQQPHASPQPSGRDSDRKSASASLRTRPAPAVQDQVKSLRQEPDEVPSAGRSSHSLSPPSHERKPSIPTGESQPVPPSHDTREVSPSREPRSAPKMSLRSVANAVGDGAYIEFTNYVERYSSLFRLAAESVKPLTETSFSEWIRAATWWFLRGRSNLEAAVRSGRSAEAAGVQPPSAAAQQAVIDLGKAWWITQHVVPQHAELARYGKLAMEALLAVLNTAGDQRLAGLVTLHQKILSHLRALTMSMKRNKVLSAVASTADGIDRSVDTSIWLKYPLFAADVTAVLSGAARRTVVAGPSANWVNTPDLMLLGDTSRFFSYGTMFVDVSVSAGDDDDSPPYVPCVLSIMRDRTDWYVMTAIASQSELINVTIQSDRSQGPTWDDVDWEVKTSTMRVRLPRGFQLDVVFQEQDFKIIWNIVKYTLKTEASMQPEADETLVFEDTLKVFQYMDPGTPKAFPAEPSQRCRVRLFEKSATVTEGTGPRKAHRGFRLTVVTSPKVKTLSSVRHTLGNGAPIVFGYLRGEDGAPALLLNVKEEGRNRSMVLTFDELERRTTMHSLLVGMLASDREFTSPDIPFRSFSIEQPPEAASPGITHLQFAAGSVSVIDLEPAYVEQHGYAPQILSEHLRALVSTDWGTVTDRMNLGPGEMKIALDVNKNTVFYMLRSGQEDLTVSVAENLVRKDLPDRLTEFLQAAKTKPMIRRYEFASLEERHWANFESSIASTFAISRRRMVVPIHKKWEATATRVQVVQQNKTIQLLAFFGSDFSHGKCMNFVLKGTDTYESFNRSGKSGVRIVDAKFALPKTDDDESSRFVCLDMPEYPIEHDDINILFESETDRKNFLAVMPGSLREPSRMGSLRR